MSVDSNKYDVIDNYSLAEIEYEYLHSDRNKKIKILESIYQTYSDTKYSIPYNVAKLFIDNADEIVFSWLAKHGKNFDYREKDYNASNEVYAFPDRNLWDVFAKHEDEYIRAAIYENADYVGSTLFSIRLESELRDLTQLQRLAFVRNSFDSNITVSSTAVKLFDDDVSMTFLSIDERNELRRAILNNKSLIDYTNDIVNTEYSGSSASSEIASLWQLIYKCNDYKSMKHAFLRLGGSDAVKSNIYSKLLADLRDADSDKLTKHDYINFRLRFNILTNCNIHDSKTLLLGINDSDEYCRMTAEKKFVEKPTDKSIKGYFKNYSPSVFQELFNIIVVVLLVSQFDSIPQLILLCTIIFSYVTLNYKSSHALINNTRQSFMLLTNIKMIGKDKIEISNHDKELKTAVDFLQIENIKLHISAVSTLLITLYLIFTVALKIS